MPKDGGGQDGDGHVLGALDHRLLAIIAALDVAVDVLEDDDGIIHDTADGDGHAGKGHDIEGVLDREHAVDHRDDGTEYGDILCGARQWSKEHVDGGR